LEKLTVAQRRMVIDYYATKLVEEWPAVLFGIEIEARLYEAALKLEWRLNRFVNKTIFNQLIEHMLNEQAFDRDPEGWFNENGIEDTEANKLDWQHYFKDIISAKINDIAGV
jgi:hypothetical protein